MNGVFFILALITLVSVLTAVESVDAAPPLRVFDTLRQDTVGKALQSSMIWSESEESRTGVAVVFRKTFEIAKRPNQATLSIFADARYVLWVNGQYVERGPSRFQPNGPQYDVIDLERHLNAGRNAIAVLVVGRLSGGKVMLHDPGLAALLEIDGAESFRTDSTWKWTDKTRYTKVSASWADLSDSVIDARVDEGDWTETRFDDEPWASAVPIDAAKWGPLTRTLIPPLREKPIPFRLADERVLPITLHAGETLEFDTGRIVQAYPVLELEADDGTEISVEPFAMRYIARAGRQKHFTLDTRGISHGQVFVKSGRATIHSLQLVERLYPFDRIGWFKCSDKVLNRIWEMCARSCEVLSEDSYVDCADRERVEWMDDTPPGFEMTRVAMAGPGPDGKKVYSDPRLLAALLRRTALTLQPDGWVKAHTCSDRYDIHAKMEDRACDWIEGQRLYYEATGDDTILRETWPAVVAQLDYFLDRRTDRGLVRARDWVVWGNPVGYLTGEGTTLNVFVYRALVDAAVLGRAIGKDADVARFQAGAEALSKSINDVLWDESSGSYFSGYFSEADLAEIRKTKRDLGVALANHRSAPSLHSNLFALDRGVVPPERRQRVIDAMLAQYRAYDNEHLMVHYYALKELFEQNRHDLDVEAVRVLSTNWRAMADAPWMCSWEAFRSGSKAHIYGMFPGYLLSTYVLGVRRDAPVANKTIRIEPRTGGLTEAEGVVVTEFGPVALSWQRSAASFTLSCSIPDGVMAEIQVPVDETPSTVVVNGITSMIDRNTPMLVVPLGNSEAHISRAGNRMSIGAGGRPSIGNP